jgi:hypothetical protein
MGNFFRNSKKKGFCRQNPLLRLHITEGLDSLSLGYQCFDFLDRQRFRKKISYGFKFF